MICGKNAMGSFNDQMIAGYVWKENEAWHSFIPANRRFCLSFFIHASASARLSDFIDQG
jgi:hypothetical protein